MTWERLGDRAFLLRDLPAEAWRVAAAYERVPGVIEAVPAWETVGLIVDPSRFVPCEVAPLGDEIAPEEHVVAVIYDGEDLEAVATEVGLPVAEVIRLHSAPVYEVVAVGFQPGFPYMKGLLPPLTTLGRLPTPRPRVPAGSVAIAAGQAGIYPSASPGGWRLLGRTEELIVDVEADFFRFAPGDRVRFRAEGI